MSQRLQGKTAFITAAGQGIGRAIAEAFVREGATVIATDISAALLHGVVEATGCRAQVLDATDAAAIRAAAAQAGPVNVLVNAAGYVHAGTVLDLTPPKRLRRSPQGAPPVARQSRFHVGRLICSATDPLLIDR
jgi:2-keto-3-deoxy-L-fuconate dehydrogenase